MAINILGRSYGLNPIKNVGNVVGQARDVGYEVGREGVTRLASGGNGAYDASNPFRSDYRTASSNTAQLTAPAAQTPSFVVDTGQTGTDDAGVLGASSSYGGAGYVDPQAAARSSFLSGMPGAISNIQQNARDAFGSAGRSLRGQAESLFNTTKQGQTSIDRSRENVELNRMNSIRDILGFVRNGLKSGASRLSNMNSLESSAAGEIARGYSDLGNDRARSVGNQAFLEGRELDTEQSQLDLGRGQGQTDFNRVRDEQVSNIGSQVRQQLAALDAEARGLGITDRVAIDQEKQRVIDEGLSQLNEVDAWLQSQLGTVRPQDAATTKANAAALQQAGTAGSNPFEFDPFGGQQISGPAIDQLPLFTRNKRITA